MKTLHLKLKRDVLIVDGQLSRMEALELRSKGWTFLCQGTPTEEQAAELVESKKIYPTIEKYIDYNNRYSRVKYYHNAVESFLSAVSAEGWNWLLNPIKHPSDLNTLPQSFDIFCRQEELHIESESRTFKNPIIFIKE